MRVNLNSDANSIQTYAFEFIAYIFVLCIPQTECIWCIP